MADRASLFNSNLMPCKLTFRTADNRQYVTMFKRGDDLRQDQLVIQMIRLMDKLLRAENLDLRLTPYQVLATSVQDGFVQFIDGSPLRDVIAEWSTIQEMFRFYRPSASGPYGVEADVIDNYVRSCAGYSVICYLLGIGDRHQHNLLLCQNGRLFHVDFGYILGRDPKPLPPPMKLTTEMINGMGGLNGVHWQEFRRLCYTAFLHLRRHANVVLNLFSLMLDAGIPDIALEPDKAVNKIEERFHLNLSDEEAVHHMQYLIDTSTSAKMPVLVDWMHDVKQMMKN
uniref:Phosphatidylinositol 3-kinase catalytic subunit type 3 n=1 Tax=Plectus sambesii TaxID=2011161 RepID=A0A914WD78_9BILA